MGQEDIDVLGQMVLARRVKERLFGASAPAQRTRYVPLDRIGQGGGGTVYRAYDTKLRREVAIKILHPSSGANTDPEKATRAMLREARCLAAFSHPNVVAVHDVGQLVDGELMSNFDEDAKAHAPVFVVMEYVEGQNLAEYLRGTKPSYEQILALFAQAAAGLSAAHEVDLVHRDFKPANVIVGRDGRVRVIDFGLARGYLRSSSQEVQPSDAATGADSGAVGDDSILHEGMAGTPAYMSPEARACQSVSPKSDQYSFCVALYEMVYGLRPNACEPGEIPPELASALYKKPRHTPHDLRERLAKGLAKDPDRRYPSLQHLLAKLQGGKVHWMRRYWPSLAGPALALLTWLMWSQFFATRCKQDPDLLRIDALKSSLANLEETTQGQPLGAIRGRTLRLLAQSLDQDRELVHAHCQEASRPGHSLPARVLARLDYLQELEPRLSKLQTASQWLAALALAQDLVHRSGGEPLALAAPSKAWFSCAQAIEQHDMAWVEQGLRRGSSPALFDCLQVEDLELQAKAARRLHSVNAPQPEALRGVYFAAVEADQAELAAEFAARLARVKLGDAGWQAAWTWYAHARAWQGSALRRQSSTQDLPHGCAPIVLAKHELDNAREGASDRALRLGQAVQEAKDAGQELLAWQLWLDQIEALRQEGRVDQALGQQKALAQELASLLGFDAASALAQEGLRAALEDLDLASHRCAT